MATGLVPTPVTPAGNAIARVAPASGFWLMALAFAILATDAIANAGLGPVARLGEVVIAVLQSSNTACILHGGLIVALLAVLLYDGLGALDRIAARRTGRILAGGAEALP